MKLVLRFGLLLLLSTGPRHVVAQTNDGFLRRDGSMYVLRNGEKRPMSHDVHLPNGRTVTRDGFVVEPDGRRAQLREGEGCTLAGARTTVATQAGGRLALAATRPATPSASTNNPDDAQRAALRQQWGRWRAAYAGQGKGHSKKKHKRKKKDHDDNDD